MRKDIEETRDIPDAPFYVLSEDNFMSGWGKAQGKTSNTLLPCESEQEAEMVAAYARSRGDQSNVRVLLSKPELSDDVLYSLLSRDSFWYRADKELALQECDRLSALMHDACEAACRRALLIDSDPQMVAG